MANELGGNVTVISATQVVTTVVAGTKPLAVGINSTSGYVYVMNWISGDVTVLQNDQSVETLPIGGSLFDISVNPLTGLTYVAGGKLTVIGDLVVPKSHTGSLLSSPTDDIVIDFGDDVVTSTVQFEISPTVSFNVTWGASVAMPTSQTATGSSSRATLSHAPFALGVNYAVHVLPGGQTVSGVPVAEQVFSFTVSANKLWLPLVLRN